MKRYITDLEGSQIITDLMAARAEVDRYVAYTSGQDITDPFTARRQACWTDLKVKLGALS